jgi:hypothetical protein
MHNHTKLRTKISQNRYIEFSNIKNNEMDGFRESAGMNVSSPIPAPKSPRGSFSLHSHRGKIYVPEAPNGEISVEIPINRCKLTFQNINFK